MTDPTMRAKWVRHNSPVRLADRARRSDGTPPAVNVQRGGVDVVRLIARPLPLPELQGFRRAGPTASGEDGRACRDGCAAARSGPASGGGGGEGGGVEAPCVE